MNDRIQETTPTNIIIAFSLVLGFCVLVVPLIIMLPIIFIFVIWAIFFYYDMTKPSSYQQEDKVEK